MAALTTGPLREAGSTVTVDIINEDAAAQQTVIMQAFILETDGTRTPFVSETFTIDPGEFATRTYSIGFTDAVEFQIDVFPSNDFSATFRFANDLDESIGYLVRPELTELTAITPIP
ncbi:hypothetical protein ACFQPF_15025 [Fictibacillus iocasae]|uniref:BppU N-terminal domain-containing protein n=1 Tax=Fictibacillus iocasae TaxID=2715437 RepID=A0ABW2NUD3_9BACL